MTATKFVLSNVNGSGLLVKQNTTHEVSLGGDFEHEQDYLDAIVKFDTAQEANAFIENHQYWGLEAVETPVSFFENI